MASQFEFFGRKSTIDIKHRPPIHTTLTSAVHVSCKTFWTFQQTIEKVNESKALISEKSSSNFDGRASMTWAKYLMRVDLCTTSIPLSQQIETSHTRPHTNTHTHTHMHTHTYAHTHARWPPNGGSRGKYAPIRRNG